MDNLGDPVGAGACTAAPGDCSLRQAVAAANAAVTADDVTFQSTLTGQVSLTAAAGGEIPISGNQLYINGPAADRVTVAAAPTSRIFNVNTSPAGSLVTIYDLTLTGGNVVGDGGAVLNTNAHFNLKECVLSGNDATEDGGAVYNAVPAGQISDTTIAGNTAGDDGGGVYAQFSSGAILNSTITGNSAVDMGGGLYSNSGGELVDATISGNGPAANGGGVWAKNGLDIYNSIISENIAAAGFDLGSVSNVFDAQFSLIKDPGGATINSTVPGSNIFGLTPQLGPLQDNGGTTPTMRPAATSPVIDVGSSDMSTDQRHGARRVDNPLVPNSTLVPFPDQVAADMGAVELTLAEGPQAGAGAPSPSPPPATKKKKKCKKKPKKKCEKKKKKK